MGDGVGVACGRAVLGPLMRIARIGAANTARKTIAFMQLVFDERNDLRTREGLATAQCGEFDEKGKGFDRCA